MSTLTPWLVQKFYETDGVTPANGHKIFTYESNSTTKKKTSISHVGAFNTNPIITNSDGTVDGLWLEAGSYKIVQAPANDTDPPTSPIKTWDYVNFQGAEGSLGIINTVDELRSIEEGSYTLVQVLGYTTVGDKNSAQYRWDATSTLADDGINILEPNVSDGTGRWIRLRDTADSIADLRSFVGVEGVSVNVSGYYSLGDGKAFKNYYWDALSVATDNGGTIIKPTTVSGAGRWLAVLDGSPITFENFGAIGDGVTSDSTIINNAIQSMPAGTVFSLSKNYGVSAQIVLKTGVSLISNNTPYSIFYDLTNFASTVGYIVYGNGISNVYIKGVYAKGAMTDYVSTGGIDAHGFFITNSTDVIINNCRASHVEKGIIFYDGCSRCEVINSRVHNCFLSGIGSYSHAGFENEYMTISNNTAYNCKSPTQATAPAGIVTEETYFSVISGNKSFNNGQGVRIENSCNNTITFNIARENEKSGIQIYNYSKRNVIYGNQVIDNNTTNESVTATTPTRDGNTGRVHSGIMLEYYGHNNIIVGNVCYNSTTGIGFQKYGISINNRNMVDEQEGDSYNAIALNVCLGNDIAQISDRGYFNRIESNITTLNEE